MYYRTIAKALTAIEGGGTLEFNGKAAQNHTGYYCSLTNYVIAGNVRVENVLQRIYRKAQKLDRKAFVGFWKDSTGKIFLDLTVRFNSLDRALEAGRAYNQQALWDIANQTEVNVREA